MSIVAVHGPNMWGGTGAGGGGTGPVVQSTPAGGGTVTSDMANGRRFLFAGAGARAAADYDWTFTGETAQNNVQSGSITFSSAGTKTITLNIPAGAGPPAGPQAYTFTVEATTTAAPRSFRPPDDETPEGEPPSEEPLLEPVEPVPDVEPLPDFDPGEHTIDEVKAYVEANPDEVDEVYEAEVEGKNRSTLVTWLEDQIPFDPGEYTVQDVLEYAESHPDELEDILSSEVAGKNRSTLVSQLEALRGA